jgi:hypothetical protein
VLGTIPDLAGRLAPYRRHPASKNSQNPSSRQTPLHDVKGAHEADLKTQERYSVAYLRYWVDESQGKVFCLIDAPNAEAATTVHREAYGLVADEIYAVREGA